MLVNQCKLRLFEGALVEDFYSRMHDIPWSTVDQKAALKPILAPQRRILVA
jgi:hypothetical protein